ncbi:MAG TPA: phage holin family protein [Candidatus Polarisedimenticolaceae bacterium]|nr:phage holin family protein [Candidatus Polarisedimenticolaceae bacterium]
MVLRFLVHLAVSALALWLVARIVPGVTVDTPVPLILGALVLGIVNTLVRPILFLLTLPITCLTLGLFYLVVNAIAFGLTAWLVQGFQVHGFVPAVLGALCVSVLSWVLGLVVPGPRDRERRD